LGFKDSLGKKFMRFHLIGKKLDVVVLVCHYNYGEKLKWEAYSPGQSGQNETLSPKCSEQKGLEAWLKQ
jgi:hypothetical protein